MKKLLIPIVLIALAVAVTIAGRTSIPAGHALVYESRPGGEPRVAEGPSRWVFPLLCSKHVYPLGARSDTLAFDPSSFRTADSEPLGLDVIADYEITPANLPSLHCATGGKMKERLHSAVLGVLGPMLRERTTFDLFRSGSADLSAPLMAALGRDASLAPYALSGVYVSSPRFSPDTEHSLTRDLARERDSGPKIVILGVDGADWAIIDPMMKNGELPNFARLVKSGTRASLESIQPMLSPRIWTSIATGKYPEEHGITDFVIKDRSTGRLTPVTSNLRRTRALWNILSDLGMPVGFVGWLATWPAEKVDGFMVSDRMAYYAYNPDRPLDASPRKTYPDDLFDTLRPLVVDHNDIGYEDIHRFLHIPAADYRRSSAAGFDLEDPVHNLRLILATTETYRRIGLRMLHRPVRLFGLYFELVDTVSHVFVRYMPPRLDSIKKDEYALYRDAVFETYRYQDEILGEVMDQLDDETILIVLSDHGFRTGTQRPVDDPLSSPAAMIRVGHGGRAARAILDHAPLGIFLAKGPGIRRGAEIHDASVMDITPTVLYLLGLPVARDMPGRILYDAMEPDRTDKGPAVTIATYELPGSEGPGYPGGENVPVASADDEALMEKLAALGYLSPDTGPDPLAEGLRLLRAGDAASAIPFLRKAAEANPAAAPLWANLGLACLQAGQRSEAETALRRALEIKPDSPGILSNLAVALTEDGRYEDAVEILEKAVELAPGNAEMRDNLGVLYVHLERPDDARRQFERAVQLDPAMPEPYGNLGAVALQEADYPEARSRLEKALLLSPAFLEARVNLARVALETGDPGEAQVHLERALETDPDNAEIQLLLGKACRETGQMSRAQAAWKRAVELDPGGESGREARALLKN